ncbi:nucleoside deaminase [Longispora sp. NPDC051575]|uniref:nucleoside deaminase n=1 Tax=Longispora sp. NPDC051575 TaxID=3154943 RepID=UPI003420B324
MPTNAIDAWAGLEPAWRACFDLAWDSFRAGSLPVGAVLVDAAGTVVRTGRNHWNEHTAGPGLVAGSRIAHAEINALATLPAADYADHVLYTTLEPCLLCTVALRFSHVGTVRFAATDPMWYSMDKVPGLNHHVARRWTVREGPLPGPVGGWAAVLHLISAVERDMRLVQACHEEAAPDVLRVARRLAPTADRLRTLSAPEALEAMWADLDDLPSSEDSGTPVPGRAA